MTASDISVSGRIEASSGSIGSFDISDGHISTNGKTWSGENNDRDGVYIGSEGIYLGANFWVDTEGNLHASNATVTGNVTANSIDFDTASISGTLSAGHINCQGVVDAATIYCSAANVTGTLTAGQIDCQGVIDAGTISADKITTGSLSVERIDTHQVTGASGSPAWIPAWIWGGSSWAQYYVLVCSGTIPGGGGTAPTSLDSSSSDDGDGGGHSF